MNKIKLNYQNPTNIYLNTDKISAKMERFLSSKINLTKIKPQIEIGINFIDRAQIKLLNTKYRHLAKSTNVLSFPIFNHIHDMEISSATIINLGDIFICLSIAQKNAKHKKRSLIDEVIFLALHGLNHLLGFHHE